MPVITTVREASLMRHRRPERIEVQPLIVIGFESRFQEADRLPQAAFLRRHSALPPLLGCGPIPPGSEASRGAARSRAAPARRRRARAATGPAETTPARLKTAGRR